MTFKVIVPDFGATHSDVEIVEWLVKEGDLVRAGQPIFIVSTDKATMEVEAFREGYVENILFPAGSKIEPGTEVAVLADSLTDKSNGAKKSAPVVTAQDDRQPGPYDDPLDIYRRMSLIRRYEDHLYALFLQGLVPGTLHQYQGEEACAVGVCSVLRQDDVIFSTHRPVGHTLAKGASVRAVTAEIWGKATGCAGGKGGQMHLSDVEVGVMPSNAIVGGGIPIAVGAAIGFKLRGLDRVAISFFGDGASNIGAVHEGVNLAAVKNAPVIFILENNLYAASTSIALTAKITDLAERASAYGIPGIVVDGMDVMAVREAVSEAVARARRGEGPTLIECKTYRFCGHSRGDPMGYRTKEELQSWREKCPLDRFRKQLIDGGVSESILDAIDRECQAQVEDAVEYAQSCPDPAPETCYEHVYAPREVTL